MRVQVPLLVPKNPAPCRVLFFARSPGVRGVFAGAKLSTVTGETTIEGHLLCAVPQLLDPNFRRSVVLMLEHGDHGALGLVINNPMSAKLDDVADALGVHWEGDPDQKVRLGGPVEPVRGWVLHEQGDWDPAAHDLAPGLWLTTSLESVVDNGNAYFGGDDARFMFLLGYAGWGEGQLEGEIAAGSWVLVPIRGLTTDAHGFGVAPEWIFETPPEQMWETALRSIRVDPQRLIGLRGGMIQ